MTDSNLERHKVARDTWAALAPGAALTIVKLAPDGSEAARYCGEVIGHREDSWLLVLATWTNRTIQVGELSFCAGDHLLEWFSPQHRFNAFAVFSPAGRLKGWYANVTHPARLDTTTDPPTLIWHDLFLDLVGLPNRSFAIYDDDELLASGLADGDPELHAQILAASSELAQRFERRLPPFADLSQGTPFKMRREQNVVAL